MTWFAAASSSPRYQIMGYSRPTRGRRRSSALMAAHAKSSLAKEPASPAQTSEDLEEVNIRDRSLGDIDDAIARLENELAELSESDGQDDTLEQADAVEAFEELPSQPKKRGKRGSTASAADDEKLPLRCEVCGVNVTSQQLMQEHLRGKKHLMAARAIAAKAEGRYCEVCIRPK